MHDARMLDTSGLYVDLAQFTFSPSGHWTGDVYLRGSGISSTYPSAVPFRHGVLTRQMEDFNAPMSSVHTSVECLFGGL